MENRDRIERDFTYHPPNPDDVWKMQGIRNHAKALAFLIDSYVPDSREKALAITNLQQAGMWANAGIVLNPSVVTMQPGSVDFVAGNNDHPDYDFCKCQDSWEHRQAVKDADEAVVEAAKELSPKARAAIENIKAIVAKGQGGCGRDGGCQCKGTQGA